MCVCRHISVATRCVKNAHLAIVPGIEDLLAAWLDVDGPDRACIGAPASHNGRSVCSTRMLVKSKKQGAVGQQSHSHALTKSMQPLAQGSLRLHAHAVQRPHNLVSYRHQVAVLSTGRRARQCCSLNKPLMGILRDGHWSVPTQRRCSRACWRRGSAILLTRTSCARASEG